MTLYALSPTRIITVYGAQGFMCAFFLFLAFKILKRDRKQLNLIFSGFYISPAIGFIINFIYAPLTDLSVVLMLNFLTNFFIFYSVIFIVVFNLILLKSKKAITTRKQLTILILYGIAMFSMIGFLFYPDFGVTFNENWSPIWSTPFFLYLVVIETIGVLPALYLSFQIYKKFEDEILKKKWKFFIFGLCSIIIFMYGIFISNALNIDVFRTVIGLVGLILALVGAYMMYYGVGRQIEK